MTAEPAATPPTRPVPLTVAMVLLLLVQPPPAVVSARVTVKPAQTVEAPEMIPAEADPVTFTGAVAMALPQLLVTVYDIVAEPLAIPVTRPEVFTEAMVAVDDDHVPPTTTSV